MWPQGGNRVKRNGEKVTETVTDFFFFRNDRFWPITAVRDGQLSAKSRLSLRVIGAEILSYSLLH